MIVDNEEPWEDESGGYYCTVCNSGFDKHRTFMDHVASHSADPETTSPDTHGRQHKVEQPYRSTRCLSCLQIFTDNESLRLHTKRWQGSCGREQADSRPSTSISVEESNYYGMNGDSEAIELYDDQSFSGDDHPCHHCGDYFNTESELRDHVYEFHETNGGGFGTPRKFHDYSDSFNSGSESLYTEECPRCNRRFLNGKALKIHLNKAHNERHSIRSPPSLTVNGIVSSQVSTGEMVSRCDECNRCFATPKQAKVHKFKSHIEPRQKQLAFLREREKNMQLQRRSAPALPTKNRATPVTSSRPDGNLSIGQVYSLNSGTSPVSTPSVRSKPSSSPAPTQSSNPTPHIQVSSALNALKCPFCESYFRNLDALFSHKREAHPSTGQVHRTLGRSGMSPSVLNQSTPYPSQAVTSSRPSVTSSAQLTSGNGQDTSQRRASTGVSVEGYTQHIQCDSCDRFFATEKALKIHCMKTHTYSYFSKNGNLSGQTRMPSMVNSVPAYQPPSQQALPRLTESTQHRDRTQSGSSGSQTVSNRGPIRPVPEQQDVDDGDAEPDIPASSLAPEMRGGQMVFPCRVCGKEFVTRAVLRRHLIVHRYGKAYKCGRCSRGFTRQDALKTHQARRCFGPRGGVTSASMQPRPALMGAHDVMFPEPEKSMGNGPHNVALFKRYRCPRCGSGCNHKSNLYTHLKRYCIYRFQPMRHRQDIRGRTLIEQAERLGDARPPSTSSLANSMTGSKADNVGASGHITVIELPNKSVVFKCRHCSRRFSLKKAITTHLVKGHGIRGMGMAFTEADKEKERKRVENTLTDIPVTLPVPQPDPVPEEAEVGAGGGKYVCPHCLRDFDNPKGLVTHRVRVHKERGGGLSQGDDVPVAPVDTVIEGCRYSCRWCPKRFTVKRALGLHCYRVHRVSQASLWMPRFDCDVCGEHFTDRIDMSQHRQLHGPDAVAAAVPPPRPSLTVSPRKQGTYKRLKVHGRAASGNYKCSECGKEYTNRLSLVGHFKSHYDQGSKPLACPDCGRRFTSKNNLRTHQIHFCPSRVIEEEGNDMMMA